MLVNEFFLIQLLQERKFPLSKVCKELLVSDYDAIPSCAALSKNSDRAMFASLQQAFKTFTPQEGANQKNEPNDIQWCH